MNKRIYKNFNVLSFSLFTAGEKRKFLITGILNLILTNIILQLLLLSSFLSIHLCTFISQLFNGFAGYTIYGKMVFNVKVFNKIFFIKYILLMLSSWVFNNIGITSMPFSRNISALTMVPILAGYSYLIQKYLIFKS